MDDALLSIQQHYPQVFHACHRKHTRSRSAPWRISERDQSLLAHMSLRSPRRASDLARHFGVGLPTMSEALKRLERQGYVVRARASDDRRALALRLTTAGAQALTETSVLDNERLRSVLEHLTPRERKKAVLGLELLARACKELAAERHAGARNAS